MSILEKEFISTLNLSREDFTLIEVVKNLAIETCEQNTKSGIKQIKGKYVMNRAMLHEFFMRMAFYMYGGMLISKKTMQLVSNKAPGVGINSDEQE